MRLTRVMLTLMALALLPIALFAQGDGGVSTGASDWYTSPTSIALASVFLVGGLKRVLGGVPVLSSAPTWCYAILSALVLVLIARSVYGTMQGNLIQVLIAAGQSAAMGSGAREWFTTRSTSLAESAAK